MGKDLRANRAGRRAAAKRAAKGAAMGTGALSTIAASLVTGSSPAGAAPFSVDNLNDSGAGSLRQAILDANANGDTEVDVITFSGAALSGTITLTSGALPQITSPVTIQGPGRDDLIVDGEEFGPVFDLFAEEITISGLTITDGVAVNGAGVLVGSAADNVVLDDVRIEDNRASGDGGGVYQSPAAENLTIADSIVAENYAEGAGGGIAASNVTIQGTAIEDNDADGEGGGVYLQPPGAVSLVHRAKAFEGSDVDAVIVQSTISGNYAPNRGGGIAVDGFFGFYVAIERSSIYFNGYGLEPTDDGGGVWVGGEGFVAIENSTISDNIAVWGGGVEFEDGFVDELTNAKDVGPYANLTIRHTTISDNEATDSGGGIYLSGGEFGVLLHESGKAVDADFYGVLLDHSIVAGNSPEDDDIADGGGATVELSARFSVLGIGPSEVTNLGGNQFDVDDPELDVLDLGGGPGTQVRTPLTGSPAQEGGDPGFDDPPAVDQLGNDREQGRIDVGAVETLGETPPPPPPSGDGLCNPAPEDGFVDVPETNVHEANVDCIAFLGITTGGPEGRPANEYGPDIRVSRGQMASFVARLIEAAGGELPADPPDAFGDDDGNEHELRINQLAAIGIVAGKADGTFGVHDQITRDQMASMLAAAYEFVVGEPLPAGPDAFVDDDGNVHEPAINALAAAGIVVGTDAEAGLYNPSGTIPRDQMATFLTNLIRALDALGLVEA